MATQNDPTEKKPAAKKSTAKKPLPEREIVKAGKAAEGEAEPTAKAAAAVAGQAEPEAAEVGETAAQAAETVEKAARPATARPERTFVTKTGQPVQAAGAKKSSMPWRIFAFLFWVIGLLGMAMAVVMIMEGNERLMFVGIGVAAVACIVGSQLWKRANRISPCTVKQDGSFGAKFKTFLWNQMGVIFTFLTFLPIGLVLLLKSEKLSAKGKQWASILTAALVLLVGAASYDYHAPVAEVAAQASAADVEQKVAAGELEIPEGYEAYLENDAYWTRYGYSFHFNQDCQAIIRSLTIYAGSLADALEARKLNPCSFCALDPATAMAGIN
jgi:hypothetical protein